MHSVISFHASRLPPEQLGRLIRDYLALDRARILRRLMVVRCGALALVATLLETAVHGFSPIARVLTVALCLIPPVWAWAVELGRARRVIRASRALAAHA